MRKNKRFKSSDERDMKKVFKYLSFILALLILIITCVFIFANNKNGKSIIYKENGYADYKVQLKDNEFYEEEYLKENGQYISDLIKNIDVNLNYNFSANEKVINNYKYRIDAVIEIKDSGNKKLIYEHKENLLEEKSFEFDDTDINIAENIQIDFKHFNELATKFIKAYGLSFNNENMLNVKLVVNTDKTEEAVVSVQIPLAKPTFAINKISSTSGNTDKHITISEENKILGKFMILTITLSSCACAYNTYKLKEYLTETRTEENIYKNEVKKILLNYGEYINQTEDFQFNLDEYEVVRVNKFIDLIKIKEDLSRPIFMVGDEKKASTIFTITDTSKFIYVFALNLHQDLLAEKNNKPEEKVGVWENE